MLRFAPLVLVLLLEVFCVIDAIQSKDEDVRNLPKIGWLVLILLFPLVGSIAWLVAGRPQRAQNRSAYERPSPQFPEYDRPGRAAGLTPESDEEFLRRIRERAEEQRRKAAEDAEEKRRREQGEGGEPEPT